MADSAKRATELNNSAGLDKTGSIMAEEQVISPEKEAIFGDQNENPEIAGDCAKLTWEAAIARKKEEKI